MKVQALVTVIGITLAAATFAGQIPPNLCPLDPQTKKITYQGVVTVEGVAAPDLYSRAKLWIANTYRSAKAVIDLDDKEGGRIIAKGTFKVPYAGLNTWDIRHELTIEVKDGRFRYTLSDLRVQGSGPQGSYENALEAQTGNPFVGHKTWERIDAHCRETVESLTKAMSVLATTDKW